MDIKPSKFIEPYTIKLKSGTKTILLLQPPSNTLADLKLALIKALHDTQPDDADDADDISIPNSSFDTVPASKGSDTDTISKNKGKSKLIDYSATNLRLALPSDPSNLEAGWIPISEVQDNKDTLETLMIRDMSVLAFATDDDEFKIRIPTFDDEDEE